jgi:hypothetical protein
MIWECLLLNMTCKLWGDGVSIWWWLFDECLVINMLVVDDDYGDDFNVDIECKDSMFWVMNACM